MNEEKAREILGKMIEPDNSLYEPSWSFDLDWTPVDHRISLEGSFSADLLEALVWWMRNKALKI